MNEKTAAILKEMIAHAKTGGEIIPMFFQPRNGTSNSVSAAIRHALKNGLLVIAGQDGCGKPKYKAPAPVATHIGNGMVN